MSNFVLAAIGMVVTMLAFAAFSVVQLAKTEARAGRPDRRRDEASIGSSRSGEPRRAA